MAPFSDFQGLISQCPATFTAQGHFQLFLFHVYFCSGGFFIEAGSRDAEDNSDSLHFELNRGWTVCIYLKGTRQRTEFSSENSVRCHVPLIYYLGYRKEAFFLFFWSLRLCSHRNYIEKVLILPNKISKT
jgi:hypothetical protein